MNQSNVNDRSSVERAYPLEAFERDIGTNSRAKADVLHGVRITSSPGADGSFGLSPASRQVGEIDVESDTVFLFPLLEEMTAMPRKGTGYGEAEPPADALPHIGSDSADYDRFVSRIIEAARTSRSKPAIGLHEERLRGFHGG